MGRGEGPLSTPPKIAAAAAAAAAAALIIKATGGGEGIRIQRHHRQQAEGLVPLLSGPPRIAAAAVAAALIIKAKVGGEGIRNRISEPSHIRIRVPLIPLGVLHRCAPPRLRYCTV